MLRADPPPPVQSAAHQPLSPTIGILVAAPRLAQDSLPRMLFPPSGVQAAKDGAWQHGLARLSYHGRCHGTPPPVISFFSMVLRDLGCLTHFDLFQKMFLPSQFLCRIRAWLNSKRDHTSGQAFCNLLQIGV